MEQAINKTVIEPYNEYLPTLRLRLKELQKLITQFNESATSGNSWHSVSVTASPDSMRLEMQ
jgi:hypothetical protein